MLTRKGAGHGCRSTYWGFRRIGVKRELKLALERIGGAR